MKCFWLSLYTVLLTGNAHAIFDHYKVTDIGLPNSSQAVLYLQESRYSNNGTASSGLGHSLTGTQILYKSGQFSIVTPPVGRIISTESDWFAYGSPIPYTSGLVSGYYRNGAYHTVAPTGGSWKMTGNWGTSQTKYIAGWEATGPTATDVTRPMLYDVTTDTRTYLPQIESSTFITAALDNGVCAVGSTFGQSYDFTLAHLWKNGQYIDFNEEFIPVALSRTEYVAGTHTFSSDIISMWHDGVLSHQRTSNSERVIVTGVSDKGDVSTYSFDRISSYIANADGIAKIDDLVVNKPSNMTIYGASINYDGHMFGQAKVGNEHHFVLLDPVPEPATWMVVGVGAVVLLRKRRVRV